MSHDAESSASANSSDPLVPSTERSAIVEFCGEFYEVGAGEQLTIGREADLVIDDNRFLHRIFLVVAETAGHWFLHNVGGQLAATLSDPEGQLEAFLPPGTSLPLVFERTLVVFSAGPTSYELQIQIDGQSYSVPAVRVDGAGEETEGPIRLTKEQRLLILALAESRLRRNGRVGISLPSSPEAARRLGWSNSKFNSKLDNVCDKLTKLGVRGLRGDIGSYASNRRARLVEYSVATRLVTAEELDILDEYIDAAAADAETETIGSAG